MQIFIYDPVHILSVCLIYICIIFVYIYGRQHKFCHFINGVTLTDYVKLAKKDNEMLSQPSQILRHQIKRCISREIKYFAIGCAHLNSNNLQSTKWKFIVIIRIWYQMIVKLMYDEILYSSIICKKKSLKWYYCNPWFLIFIYCSFNFVLL